MVRGCRLDSFVLSYVQQRGYANNVMVHLPMKMEPTLSTETSAVRTQTPRNYPKRNTLQGNGVSEQVHHHHHHHHHISVMELGHLLTRSGLTYPEVSSRVYHDFFCQLESSISLPWVIYFKAFYLHVVSSFSFIPVICPILVLFLTPLEFVHLFYNLSKCILLFFSCISSLLLLFF